MAWRSKINNNVGKFNSSWSTRFCTGNTFHRRAIFCSFIPDRTFRMYIFLFLKTFLSYENKTISLKRSHLYIFRIKKNEKRKNELLPPIIFFFVFPFLFKFQIFYFYLFCLFYAYVCYFYIFIFIFHFFYVSRVKYNKIFMQTFLFLAFSLLLFSLDLFYMCSRYL